jgi:hypothetical protein
MRKKSRRSRQEFFGESAGPNRPCGKATSEPLKPEKGALDPYGEGPKDVREVGSQSVATRLNRGFREMDWGKA